MKWHLCLNAATETFLGMLQLGQTMVTELSSLTKAVIVSIASVIDDCCVLGEHSFGFGIQAGGHLVNLIFRPAATASQPDLPTAPDYFQFFIATFTRHSTDRGCDPAS